jgi:HSP20 family protein
MAFQFTWPREVSRLQSEMDQLFGRGNGSFARPQAYPAINVLEDDDNFYIESEVPGMELDQFELFVNDENQLTLQGERKSERDTSGNGGGHFTSYGKFYRAPSVPAGIEADKIEASYKNGILEVHLPKGEAAKSKRIAVQAK